MSRAPKDPKSWVSVPTQTKKINLPHNKKAAAKPGDPGTSQTPRPPKNGGGR